jgi:hypothetical protein
MYFSSSHCGECVVLEAKVAVLKMDGYAEPIPRLAHQVVNLRRGVLMPQEAREELFEKKRDQSAGPQLPAKAEWQRASVNLPSA